jgi:PAS domain S-box-containing protein
MKSPLRVLHLENDTADAELAQDRLEMGGIVCEMTRVETETDFVASLQHGGFDLILADYTLPSFDGLSAMRIALEQRPDLPFIFVSGTLGEDVAIEALKIGATDYVLKTRLSRLVPAVQRALGEVAEKVERKRAEEELQQLVDLVPQLIVVLEPDGKCIHANRMAREYTGLTLEEFRFLDVIRVAIHPDDVQGATIVRERGLAGNEPFEFDARVLGKDGTYRWFLVRYNPFVEENRVRRWYVSATEIESRKQEEGRIRQENVRLEERTRIAQELHDTLLQSFLSASMQLGVAVDGVPSDSPVKGRLDRVLQLMEQGIEDGRKALQGLRLSDAQPLDLVQAFSCIQRELAIPSDLEFRVTVIGEERPLHLGIQHEIYRIGSEALINAFHHSRATRVEVDLEYADSELRMRVRDNGCGIDPRVLKTGRERHWGLAGMRERAAKIGGLLKIWSNASTGTEVELSIPNSIALEVSLANRPSE